MVGACGLYIRAVCGLMRCAQVSEDKEKAMAYSKANAVVECEATISILRPLGCYPCQSTTPRRPSHYALHP